MKGQLQESETRPPVAVLFGRAGSSGAEDVLDELAGLAEAADVGVGGRLVQALARPLPATFIGSGKVQELKALVQSVHAELALADVDLSPAQARNLTKTLGRRTLASAKFARCVPRYWESTGEHTLKGVGAPLEVVALKE